MLKKMSVGAALAVLYSTAMANPAPTQVTDCTNGCTVIACNAETCAVNVYGEKGWHIAATYKNPSPKREAGEARYELWPSTAGKAPPPGNVVLAPSDANNQRAKVCKATASDDCSIYTVSVDGAVKVGKI